MHALRSVLAKHQLAAPGCDLVDGGEAGTPQVARCEMALQAEGHAVLGDFLNEIHMRLDNLGGRPERYVQMRVGIGDRAEQIGLVRPIAHRNLVF